MFDPGRHMNEAGFCNGHLLAIDDKIDFSAQIRRIVHIAAHETDYFIVIMRGFGMRPRYGA